jgi:hypothetical protein
MVENMAMVSEINELFKYIREIWELELVVSTATNNLCTRKITRVFCCQNITSWKIHGWWK